MVDILGQGAPAGGPPGDLIKDSSIETFAEDVIEASSQVPVIVDFWAPWCGPCKQLTPTLEKVVNGARGAVKMVKVNIDENQPLAQQLRIQSIPAVFAFKDGQPVDGFMGALPESQVRTFIERLTGDLGPSPIEEALEAANQALEAGDVGNAAQTFAAILQEDQGNAGAIAGLTQCYIKTNNFEQAKQTLALTPPESRNDPLISAAEAALHLAEQAGDTGEIDELNSKVETNPKDHASRFDLAVALNAIGDREGAVDHLLEIVRLDRNWNEEAARKQLVILFDAFGPTDEVTLSGRRRLSSMLFS